MIYYKICHRRSLVRGSDSGCEYAGLTLESVLELQWEEVLRMGGDEARSTE